MRNLFAALSIGLMVAVLVAPVSSSRAEKPARATLRIGVYDSRAIAIAYARSAEFQQAMSKLQSDLEQAKAKGDAALVKKLSKQGPWMQVRLHQQGFSTAGVTNIMAKVADALPGIARGAGVAMIVSKWEMPFKNGSIEVVDVTLPIVRLFKPDPQTLQLLNELKRNPPVPFDELGLDTDD